MKVEEIMTPAVVTCHPNDMLTIPAQRMWDRDCGSVPVVEGDRLVGMITDRDICMAAYTQGLPLTSISVSSAMTPKPWSCQTKDSVDDAERLMRDRQIRRLPVMDRHGRLVGLLSLNDIVRHRSRERDGEEHALVETLAAISRPRAFDLGGAAP